MPEGRLQRTREFYEAGQTPIPIAEALLSPGAARTLPHQHLWRRQDATEAEYGRAECVVCGQTSTCKEAFDV